MARIHYKRLDRQFYYWRTNHGAEVDLLLCAGNRIVCALEIKSSHNIVGEQLGGLKSFIKDNPGIPAYVLGAGQSRRRLHDDITVITGTNLFLKNWKYLNIESRACKSEKQSVQTGAGLL